MKDEVAAPKANPRLLLLFFLWRGWWAGIPLELVAEDEDEDDDFEIATDVDDELDSPADNWWASMYFWCLKWTWVISPCVKLSTPRSKEAETSMNLQPCNVARYLPSVKK